MEGFLDFARGPLFRLTFAIMVLGLLRVLLLDLWGMAEAYYKAGDKKIPWGLTISRTVEWVVPVKRLTNNRALYSIASILFHIGLILVPLFLFAHVALWEGTLGFGWWTLPKAWADWLTISTIAFALALLMGRVFSRPARGLSRKQDYIWPILLIIPFITGYICANMAISPSTYRAFMLVHVLSGELIFVCLPFTKIAHCVLQPLSQFVSVIAWKFPAETDDEVGTTLNKKGAPV